MKFRLLVLFVISVMTTGCIKSEQQKEFVKGCVYSGVSSSVCDCVYEHLAGKYGEDGLRYYGEHPTEEFDTDIKKSVNQCQLYYG